MKRRRWWCEISDLNFAARHMLLQFINDFIGNFHVLGGVAVDYTRILSSTIIALRGGVRNQP